MKSLNPKASLSAARKSALDVFLLFDTDKNRCGKQASLSMQYLREYNVLTGYLHRYNCLLWLEPMALILALNISFWHFDLLSTGCSPNNMFACFACM